MSLITADAIVRVDLPGSALPAGPACYRALTPVAPRTVYTGTISSCLTPQDTIGLAFTFLATLVHDDANLEHLIVIHSLAC